MIPEFVVVVAACAMTEGGWQMGDAVAAVVA